MRTLVYAFGVVALFGCGDAIHLDPGGAGGGGETSSPASTGATAHGGGSPASTGAHTTTSTGGGSEGGSAPVGCASNSDCPFPTPVCDTVYGTCVECLEVADCVGKPGTVCSLGACSCPVAADSFCAADDLGASARCVDLKTSGADCGSCGHACFGACAAGACADPWEPTGASGAPSPRANATAVWTGSRMIVWGGAGPSGLLADGASYDPVSRAWTPVSPVNAPVARQGHTAVWDSADKLMIVWGGGTSAGDTGDGAAYDPATDTWSTLPAIGAPGPRQLHTAVWDGAHMHVWGGEHNGTNLGDGASLDPSHHMWSTISTVNAPTPRRAHTAVVIGGKMIVYGGQGISGLLDDQPLADGASFDPGSDPSVAWSPIASGPVAESRHRAVVVGNAMHVFGGYDGVDDIGASAIFTPATGAWSSVSGAAPGAREAHTMVVVSMPTSKAVVWGGNFEGTDLGDGALEGGAWSAPLPTAPTPRYAHVAVATDDGKMIVWGGLTPTGYTSTGAILDVTQLP
jgi:hypothetical protein